LYSFLAPPPDAIRGADHVWQRANLRLDTGVLRPGTSSISQGSLSRAQVGYLFCDDWRYERFITTIEQKAGIPWSEAERAARATLQTLAERLTALAADEIVTDAHAALGPIDPQLGQYPAASLVEVARQARAHDDQTPIMADVGRKAIAQVEGLWAGCLRPAWSPVARARWRG
jgi:uncharacterized protein (DUF2267 family)